MHGELTCKSPQALQSDAASPPVEDGARFGMCSLDDRQPTGVLGGEHTGGRIAVTLREFPNPNPQRPRTKVSASPCWRKF